MLVKLVSGPPVAHMRRKQTAAEAGTMERDRKDDRDDDSATEGSVADSAGQRAAEVAVDRLLPRPDKGLEFTEALDKSIRDHRNVFAALAK